MNSCAGRGFRLRPPLHSARAKLIARAVEIGGESRPGGTAGQLAKFPGGNNKTLVPEDKAKYPSVAKVIDPSYPSSNSGLWISPPQISTGLPTG